MVLGFTLSKSKSRSITKTQQSIQGGMKKIPSRKLKKFFKIPDGNGKNNPFRQRKILLFP